MDGTTNPEEAAFRRYYNDLFSAVSRPVQLAGRLFSQGVITRDIKASITSNEDKDQKRAVLDAVQNALASSDKAHTTFEIVCRALDESGVDYLDIGKLRGFVSGKY